MIHILREGNACVDYIAKTSANQILPLVISHSSPASRVRFTSFGRYAGHIHS